MSTGSAQKQAPVARLPARKGATPDRAERDNAFERIKSDLDSEFPGKAHPSPRAAVLKTNAEVMNYFQGAVRGEDSVRKGGQNVQTAEEQDALTNNINAGIESTVVSLWELLLRYRNRIVTIRKDYDNRVKEIWDKMPALAEEWSDLLNKITTVSIAGGTGTLVYSFFDMLNKDARMILGAVGGVLGYLAANKFGLKIISSALKWIDSCIMETRLRMTDAIYSGRKVKLLEALARYVNEETAKAGNVKLEKLNLKTIQPIIKGLPSIRGIGANGKEEGEDFPEVTEEKEGEEKEEKTPE